jgi:hypothetical protein
MNKNEYDINLLLQNAESIEKDISQRNTALLRIKLNSSHIKILNNFEQNNISFYTQILSDSKGRINLSDLQENDIITLDISPNFLKTNLNFNFYFTFDEFIEKNSTSISDKYFFILDEKITSFNKENEKLKVLDIIIQLNKIFNDISDDVEKGIKFTTYTIFDTKKLKINSNFQKDDITFLLENNVNFGEIVYDLYNDLEVVSEKKIRTLFFKKAMEATFDEKNLKMSNILRNIGKLFEEYESHYRAYINSLEPEKIKQKFQEEHNTFLKELNSILTDIHNKIIFIPLAFIFGASQLTSGELMKGLIIILGMLIFTIFVSTFLDTHEKVLNILNNKLIERDSYYKDEEPSMYKNYKAKIKELADLVKNIKDRIIVVKYANWILTFIATSVFYYLNK